MVDYAEEEYREAQAALADAEKMRQVRVTDRAVVTRLYYACFHAANAVLYARELDPRTHQGTLRLFGKEVVEAGDAARNDGRFLNDMRSYRQVADYTHEPLEVDVDELLERTRAFVTDMGALL